MRERVKLGASGKLVSAYDICRAFALGADYTLSARDFMFAAGCIQARHCHTNRCPSGVATQDPIRQKALVVDDKAPRVANFHRNTLKALAVLLGAAGLEHPTDIKPWHLHVRGQNGQILRGSDFHPQLAPGALLAEECEPELAHEWRLAQAESFDPAPV